MSKYEKVKVLHVVGAMNRAGTETMLMNIYRNIDREKVQFDFISYSQEDAHYDDEIRNLGGKIIKLNKATSIKELSKAIKENGPYKVVHAHTLFNSGIAMLAAKRCGVKIRISHAHTTFDDNSNLIRNIYINSMRYLINRNSTNILACSKAAGEYLFGAKELNKAKYKYFPNLINYEDLLEYPDKEVIDFKNKLNLKEGITIGHIGTFKDSKNHKFLLEILRYMVSKGIDTNLLLVGDGSIRNDIENIAIEYGIKDRVKFVGVRDDINVMLHSMDVFVFPSIYEGLGLVLLEAQATGLPCVVSEAIQPEADLGIDLFTRLNLDSGVEVWSNEIIKVVNNRERDLKKIKSAFDDNGYSTSKCISKLSKIYGI